MVSARPVRRVTSICPAAECGWIPGSVSRRSGRDSSSRARPASVGAAGKSGDSFGTPPQARLPLNVHNRWFVLHNPSGGPDQASVVVPSAMMPGGDPATLQRGDHRIAAHTDRDPASAGRCANGGGGTRRSVRSGGGFAAGADPSPHPCPLPRRDPSAHRHWGRGRHREARRSAARRTRRSAVRTRWWNSSGLQPVPTLKPWPAPVCRVSHIEPSVKRIEHT